MPFDGRNFTETKPDVFSLEGLIAWLEKQPAETEYEYTSSRDCMLCRYFRAHGIPVTGLSLDGYSTGSGINVEYPIELAAIAQGSTFFWARSNADVEHHGRTPWSNVDGYSIRTYGAALERARALQSRAA